MVCGRLNRFSCYDLPRFINGWSAYRMVVGQSSLAHLCTSQFFHASRSTGVFPVSYVPQEQYTQ